MVVGYGLAGRLVPGIVHLHRSASAGGRLEQPLTYWNGMGALAAMGVVLCVRLAGDVSRPVRLRAAAAAAVPALGTGLYLTFSRGALLTVAAGLLALIALAPSWPQARALVIAVEGGVLAAALSSLFGGVEALSGLAVLPRGPGSGDAGDPGRAGRDRGAPPSGGPAARRPRAGRRRAGSPSPAARPRWSCWWSSRCWPRPWSRPPSKLSANARLRGDRVALRLGGIQPLRLLARGPAHLRRPPAARRRRLAASGWRGSSTARSTMCVRDAHSLYLETAAELGLVGLALLAAFLGGHGRGGAGAVAKSPGARRGAQRRRARVGPARRPGLGLGTARGDAGGAGARPGC